MNSHRRSPWLAIFAILLLVLRSHAQEPSLDSTRTVVPSDTGELSTIESTSARTLPLVDTLIQIPLLDFTDTPLYDALTALARSYKLSFYIDSSVTGRVIVRLENVTLNDALLFIMKEHGLTWERTGGIVKIFKPVPAPPALPPVNIHLADSLLSIQVQSVEVSRFVAEFIAATGQNMILEKGVTGQLTGTIVALPMDQALAALFTSNGFALTSIDNVYYVNRPAVQESEVRRFAASIQCDSGLVSADLRNSPLADAVAGIAAQCGISIVTTSRLEGETTATFSRKSVEDALLSLLINTPYSFRSIGGVYLVGPKEGEQMLDSRLLPLRYLIAVDVEPLVPAALAKQVSLKVVKEHNGLLVTGPRTAIAQVESFLKGVDTPVAQVLFEVLVVDYTTTDRAEFSLIANNYGGDSGKPSESYYPFIDLNRTGKEFNRDLNSLSRRLGISNLGTLPDNFFIRLRAMVEEGKANVRSKPQIASMNGHTADIKIGTTQYFLLESETTYPGQQTNPTIQTTQRFEKIEANMSLQVTPFVSPDGDLIVDIKPEFSSPVGSFDPDIPPTINRRELHSTVRLRNGETIVLGGLIESSKVATIAKVPILGSIPILGRLFQNRRSTDRQSDLMIYITPRVYFGSEGSVNIEKEFKE